MEGISRRIYSPLHTRTDGRCAGSGSRPSVGRLSRRNNAQQRDTTLTNDKYPRWSASLSSCGPQLCLVSQKILSICGALAGRAGLRDGRLGALLRLGRVGLGVASPRPPSRATTRQPGAEPNDARAGSVEGCLRAAVWSGCRRDAPAQRARSSMIPVHDRSACTFTVNSRAEVRTRASWVPRPRLLIRHVPFNPLD